jgi:hypothetical protein
MVPPAGARVILRSTRGSGAGPGRSRRWDRCWEGGGPDYPLGALLDRARGARAAHVGLDPAGLDGVDEDAAPPELGGEDAREGVEGSLGDAVARVAAAHVLEGREACRHVHYPTVAVALHEGYGYLAEAPGAEQVGLERLPHAPQIGFDAALSVVVGDRGVVHQDVEPPELLLDEGREPVHTLFVGYVELVDCDATAKTFGSSPAVLLVPGAHHDSETSFGELAADLEPYPPIPSAHKRDATVLYQCNLLMQNLRPGDITSL